MTVWALTGPGPNPLASLADDAVAVEAPTHRDGPGDPPQPGARAVRRARRTPLGRAATASRGVSVAAVTARPARRGRRLAARRRPGGQLRAPGPRRAGPGRRRAPASGSGPAAPASPRCSPPGPATRSCWSPPSAPTTRADRLRSLLGGLSRSSRCRCPAARAGRPGCSPTASRVTRLDVGRGRALDAAGPAGGVRRPRPRRRRPGRRLRARRRPRSTGSASGCPPGPPAASRSSGTRTRAGAAPVPAARLVTPNASEARALRQRRRHRRPGPRARPSSGRPTPSP